MFTLVLALFFVGLLVQRPLVVGAMCMCRQLSFSQTGVPGLAKSSFGFDMVFQLIELLGNIVSMSFRFSCRCLNLSLGYFMGILGGLIIFGCKKRGFLQRWRCGPLGMPLKNHEETNRFHLHSFSPLQGFYLYCIILHLFLEGSHMNFWKHWSSNLLLALTKCAWTWKNAEDIKTGKPSRYCK